MIDQSICSAALAFDNPEDAGNVLSAFRSDPHIEVAGLYRADGSLFATYPPSAALHSLPEKAVVPGYRFSGGSLIGVAEVRENQRVLGTLFVRSDMEAIYERLGWNSALAAAVIALALLVAWGISRRYD